MLSPDFWAQALWETLYMVAVSTVVSDAIGLPVGLLLVVSDKGGIRPIPVLNTVLGVVVNILRSVPFLILGVMITPMTRATDRLLDWHDRDDRAADHGGRPLCGAHGRILHQGGAVWRDRGRAVYGGKPVADRVEGACAGGQALAHGRRARSRSSLSWAIPRWPGCIGGGGLGAVAVTYGYNRYQFDIMLVAVIIIVVVVQIFQEAGLWLARRLDKRNR